MPPKRNLLVCFDAFGTLFTPKRPIAQQYGEVARSLGLGGFTDEDLQQSFRTAFKDEAKKNPNYGKATDLGSDRWWTNIIHNTFKPLAPANQPLPSELAPKLLHRFASSEGYTLYPDILPLLQKLRGHTKVSNGRLVVGVITNSDNRVPDILSSLGVRVSPLRYGETTTTAATLKDDEYDVDFTVMSYDVGHEKPDKRIFKAGEEMLGLALKGTEGAPLDPESFRKIYVGDEYEKDIAGALQAGWDAVLVDRESTTRRPDLLWLDDRQAEYLQDVFQESRAVAFTSLSQLAKWIPEHHN